MNIPPSPEVDVSDRETRMWHAAIALYLVAWAALLVVVAVSA